jgi:hypothetical protein
MYKISGKVEDCLITIRELAKKRPVKIVKIASRKEL